MDEFTFILQFESCERRSTRCEVYVVFDLATWTHVGCRSSATGEQLVLVTWAAVYATRDLFSVADREEFVSVAPLQNHSTYRCKPPLAPRATN